MDDETAWFAPKRYGYGSGLPIRWQGWVLSLAYLLLILVLGLTLRDEPLELIAVLVPFTVAFMVICARTTRGGWRWRWGDDS